MEADPEFPAPPSTGPRRPRGRPPSSAWAFFTTITEPQKQASAVCRHCNQEVNHRKKWAGARTHLMKCAQFLRMMDTVPPSEVPNWYMAEINRRQQNLELSRSKAALNIPAVFQNQIPTQMVQNQLKVIQPISVPVANMMPISSEIGHSLLNLGKVDLKKVQNNVNLHLLTTLPVEQLLQKEEEEKMAPFLLQALQACSGELIVPNKEKLMTEVLDQGFENVKGRVSSFFKSGLVPVGLSLEEVDEEVHYMATLASSEKYPMFLESLKVSRSGEVDADAERAAKDVARVVEKLTCPVAGCVLPCSTTENRQMRTLLENQFPAMYFHGCFRDALLAFVRQLFSGTGTTETERKRSVTVPFVQDLQQFALQCKDLAFFLPRQEKYAYLYDDVSVRTNNMVHVTARRRLTVEEAFSAILQAEPFLDAESVLSQLFSSHSNGNSSDGSSCGHHRTNIAHLQTQLVKMVRSPQFVEKLRKYLEVLRPVHELLSNSTTLLLSEVYYSFSRLAQQFSASSLLQHDEKAALQALVQQQQNVLGSAHLLAYLLDPVLLGEYLPVDTKTEVEQKLMSSFRADGTPLSDSDKEALYTQYIDFKKTSSNQKANKAETVAFRTLKERKKSPLQFWFADGAKWPVLQAIACRIFVMPVCAPSSASIASEIGLSKNLLREKMDPPTSDKLTYVRVNTRQLQLADVEGSSLASLVQSSPVESSTDITASMIV